MNDYIKTALLTVAVAALCRLLLPEGQEKLRRASEFGISLFVLAVLIRPLPLSLPSVPSWDSPPAVDCPAETWETLEASAGEGVVADLSTRFSLDQADLTVRLTLKLTDNNLTVDTLTLTVTGDARRADLVKIKSYLQKTYTQKAEVLL